MSEAWKKIPGFGDRFSVSSLGRVRNDETGTIRKLTAMKYGMGYRIVCLKHLGYAKTLYVHHLAFAAFKGPVPPDQEIRHRDGNVDHNDAENLIPGTRAQNLADKLLHGTQTRGEAHATSKLTESQVLEIRRRSVAGETGAALAREFGVALMTISKIINRKTWAHLP